MAWFPRELIDVVMCCAHPKRVSQIGTKGVLHMGMVYMTSHSNRFRDHREVQHLDNVGSHWRKPCYNQIRGRNHKLLCRWSLRKRWNRNGTTCPSQTQKDFQVGSEDWNDVLLTGQRIRQMKDPQSGPSLEVSQRRRLENWRRSLSKRTRKKISTALLQCIHGTEAFWDR